MDLSVSTTEQVLGHVTTALAEITQQEADKIGPDTRLFDELGLDSTGMLELLMRIEESVGVEFDTDTLEQSHLETAGSLTAYVRTLAG
jgi:acyl carrier protein